MNSHSEANFSDVQTAAAQVFLCAAPRPAASVRLICFPHGGGGAHSFRDWAAALPAEIEVLAYQPPGRGPRRREPPIEEMATLSTTLAAALEPFLDRPYALFGHSVGALIAFESARRLAEFGARAPLRLFLSGYSAPDIAERAAAMHELADDALWEQVAGLGLSPDLAAAGRELRALALPSIRADFRLSETHRVDRAGPPLAAPLTLLSGAEDAIAPPESLRGWRDFSVAETESRTFPGGHFFTESAQGEVLALVAERLLQDAPAQVSAQSLELSVLHASPHNAPAERTLDDLFREQAMKTPDRLAIDAHDRRLSFAELDRLSDLLARRLRRLGAGRDRLVGLLLETSADYMVAYIAALKSGAAYLPLDPGAPAAALSETLEKLRPVALVTRPALAKKAPQTWRDARLLALGADWPEAFAEQDGGEPVAFEGPAPDDLAYAVTSSGTTGEPKAILCPHRGAVISYWWRYTHLPYGDDEREAANVFFVWEAMRPLLQGRPLYPIPDETIYDPARLVDMLERQRITRVLFTPSLLEQILRAAELGRLGDLAERLSGLRMILLNGEVVTAALWRRAARLLPHVRLVNDYSISECHDVCHIDLSAGAPTAEQNRAPAGHVMDGVSIYLLDEDGAPVPWGQVGEVYVGGETLARGYLGLEDETRARFLPDPFRDAPGARMFRTGDLGRLLPDGALDISGRAKFLIKLRGYSIVPGAVEAAMTAHAEISAAAVLAADDPQSGVTQGIVAYYSPTSRDDALSARELRAHLKARLPAYAVPARLIPLEPWPIDAATGKLDRKRLPDPWRAFSGVREARENEAPAQSYIVERLSALWAETLGQAPDGPEADFFDLGGHSLKAVELALAIEESFGAKIDVVDLFDRPKLRDMADWIAQKRLGAAPALSSRDSAAPRTERHSENAGEIAVLSLAGRFAGAENETGDLAPFWDLLAQGRSGLQRLTEAELRALGAPPALTRRADYVPVAGHLRDIDLFDAQLFGLSAREAALMDPQHRLFLESCWRALEFAGYAPRGAEAALGAQGRHGGVGVWAGCWLPLYLTHHLGGAAALNAADPSGFHLAEIGNDKDYLASRAAYLLDLRGPATVVQTSCSTGLVAIAEAAQALRDGRCDMALAGAASLIFPRGGYIAEPGHVGSPTGACRTFDAAADGVVFSDGVGVVALKRLEDALADGDPVLAVIKGFAVSSDGSGKAGFSAPSAQGQERAIAAALADARVSPGSVDYVEAHGTGTVIGDPIETTALTRAYGQAQGEEPSTPQNGAIRLGSLKPNIGHANIASGVAGFAKAALALQRRMLPPTIGVETSNPRLGLERSPFRLQTAAEPWRRAAGPRRAGVSSLGVGGVNCHMLLEEAPTPPPDNDTPAEPEALLLSARSAEGLAALAAATADWLAGEAASTLSEAAETLRNGRETMPYRLALAVENRAAAPARLRAAAAKRRTAVAKEEAPRLAWVFPGHGAQHPRMGAGLYAASPVFRRRFDECRSLFADLAASEQEPLDLLDLFETGDDRAERLLARPIGLQASVFSIQVAMAALLESAGARPYALVGHSLGEYAAAVAADMLDLEAAVALVAARALATEASPPGAMLAVSGPENETAALAERIGGLTIAARNAPGECAVAGSPEAVDAFADAAPRCGLKIVRLAAPRAFHSPLMEEAARSLGAASREIAAASAFRAPRSPFVSTLSGAQIASDVPLATEYWARQMREPVAFGAAVAQLAAMGAEAFLEIGPGQSLRRLVSKTLQSESANAPNVLAAMRHPKDDAADLDALHRALGELWERGAEIDWTGFREPRRRPRRIALPGPRFERSRHWVEAARNSASAPASAETLSPPDQRLYLPGFHRAAAGAPAAPGALDWLAVMDPAAPGPLDSALVAGLRAAGDKVGISDLQAALDADTPHTARVLWLRGAFADAGAVGAAELTRFGAALAQRAKGQTTIFALSAGALAVGGERLRPEAGLRLGPLLAMAQETPAIGARAIDLDPERPVETRRIVQELRAADLRPEPFCALRGAHLWVEDAEACAAPAEAQGIGRRRLAEAGPLAITGGFGRIGQALTERLAGLGAPLLLVGRSPERGASQVDRLRRGGARIETLALDIAAPGAAETLFAEAQRRFGGLGGVFHAAGLADLKYLAETNTESLEAEFAAKVQGTEALAAALRTQAQPPDFVVLFSSLAASLGGLGMSGYSAANRYLDLLAEREAAKGGATQWLSIAWDDWDFQYDHQQVGAWERTRSGLSLPPTEALDALEALLGAPGLSGAMVAATPLAPRIERWRQRATRAVVSEPIDGSVEDREVNALDDAATTDPFLNATLQAYLDVLGGDVIDPAADFFHLGGDSLMATQLCTRLSELLHRFAPQAARPRIADVFDHPTPASLAERLRAQTPQGPT